MSIIRPKDGDYIVRGLLLLFCWTCFGWVPFTILGGVVAGAGGAACGLFASILFGAFILYPAYLRLDPKVYRQRKTICGQTRADRK